MDHRASPVPLELLLELDSPAQLFSVREGTPRRGASLVPGMEYLLNEIKGASGRRPVRTTIVLPPDEVEAGTEEGVREAIAWYCRFWLRHEANEMRAEQRDGRRALVVGLVVLAIGLFVSQMLSGGSIPSDLRLLLGEGVFLVVAWVALWYPLDVLLYGRRPHVVQRRALQAALIMDVVVRPSPLLAGSPAARTG